MKNTLPRQALLASALVALSSAAAGQQAQFQPRMGEPLPGLTASELNRFLLGRAEFDHVLSEAEGLGPIFNDSSCGQCHSTPAIGGSATTRVTRFGKAADGPNPFDPLASLGGSLLQKSLIAGADPSCEEVVPPEADVVIERVTPICFGSGLLEAIPDADIVANETTPPHGSVAGAVRMVAPVEGGPARPGRMGWKGGVATVLTFSADASVNELGLTNRFFTAENAPNGDPAKLLLCDTVSDPEDGPDGFGFDRIDRQTDFQRFLAPPPQTPRSGMTGETLFDQVGCTACHIPDFTTGTAPEAALSGVDIKPYGDFLLHDMGTLGDGIVDGPATENVMMTRALWGVGYRESLLHDGRSTGGSFQDNVDDAVAWHDGEAAFSRDAYQALDPVDQALIGKFLQSLGRPEFDIDGANNTVDIFDFFFLEEHFNGPAPAVPHTPDDDGALADVDQDGDYDLQDALVLQRAFTGQ